MSSYTLEDAFPNVDAGVIPFGSRVLVQIKTPRHVTQGGIILTDYSKDAEKDNTQVCKVISMGPCAFRNRNTLELWPEGAWCKVGDFVRVPRWGGDRWSRPTGKQDVNAHFVIFNDLDIVGALSTDPMEINAYIG